MFAINSINLYCECTGGEADLLCHKNLTTQAVFQQTPVHFILFAQISIRNSLKETVIMTDISYILIVLY